VVPITNYGFVIDNRRCIGCHACTVACKAEHDDPIGVNKTWVKQIEKGEFPNTNRNFSVMRCNHCDDSPCTDVCPTTVLWEREDGIVDFDPERCIGCVACMQGCPYDALYIDPTGLLVGGGLGLLVGSWTGAPRLIKALSRDYSSLGPRRSIAALIPAFVIAQTAILLGIPVSFNQIIVSTIIGSGATAEAAGIGRRKITYTALAWAGSLTLALLSATVSIQHSPCFEGQIPLPIHGGYKALREALSILLHAIEQGHDIVEISHRFPDAHQPVHKGVLVERARVDTMFEKDTRHFLETDVVSSSVLEPIHDGNRRKRLPNPRNESVPFGVR